MMDFSLRKILTIPNFLSALRIILVPFIGWLLFIDSVEAAIWAGVLLFIALLTDFLDGFLARLLKQVSDLGKIIDPLADKLFVILLAVELIYLRDFPLWLALVIVAKDALIVGAGTMVIGSKKVVMQSNIIGKYAFGMQAGLVVSYFLDFGYGEWFFTIATLLLIAASLVSYGKALLFIMRSTEEEVIVPDSPQIVPAWARRSIVVILLAVWSFHLYYWALENNEFNGKIVGLPAVVDSEAAMLANIYAPHFVFSATDDNKPISVEMALTKSDLVLGERYLLGLLDGKAASMPLSIEALSEHSSEHSYLVVDYDKKVDSTRESSVYYRAFHVNDPEGEVRIVLQYWLLFLREEIPVRRYGDWQMAAICFDASSKPLYLVTTQGWSGETVRWENVSKQGDRPIVYVAAGSNSFYAVPGKHPVYLDQDDVFNIGEVDVSGIENDSNDVPYELIPLKGDEVWLKWPGRWGGPFPAGDRGPSYWNPKRTRFAPWSHPLEFMRYYLPAGNN